MKRRAALAVSVGASAVMLLGAVVADWPRDYYVLLRVVVFGTAVYLAVVARQHRQDGWVVVLAALALLFNPAVPVRLGKDTWRWADLATVLVLVLAVRRVRS